MRKSDAIDQKFEKPIDEPKTPERSILKSEDKGPMLDNFMLPD